MANLYEIDQAILGCIDQETGEIIDAEMLDSLQMERDAKIENVVCWYKNLLSDAEAIKAEKTALADREAKCRAKAEKLKAWLAEAIGGQEFSTAKCAVSFRRSDKVEVINAAAIPVEFLNAKTELVPDKTAIKAAIKSGIEVSGCCLVENINPQIK